MKKFLLPAVLLCAFFAHGQKIDSIYVHLYTDSLKKGTFNYINIDGLLSNGKYLPLDSSHIIFWASEGRFSGNNLWLDRNFNSEKVHFKVTLRNNPKMFKEFVIYVKKTPDPELKTLDVLMAEKQSGSKRKKNQH